VGLPDRLYDVADWCGASTIDRDDWFSCTIAGRGNNVLADAVGKLGASGAVADRTEFASGRLGAVEPP
jgi:hypothetical protein